MTSGYTSRVAIPQDANAITQLLETAYSTLLRDSYEADTLDPILPRITQSNPELLSSGSYYVAEDSSGVAVGCGGWSLKRPGDGEVTPNLGHIRHFGVHPDWTRRGVGRQLFGLCVRNAKLQDVRLFECYSSLNGESFYASLGFQRVRPIDIPIGPLYVMPSVLMQFQF